MNGSGDDAGLLGEDGGERERSRLNSENPENPEKGIFGSSSASGIAVVAVIVVAMSALQCNVSREGYI